jgi:ABC-type oligopeptide transport system substrate-binding subunit
MPTMHIRYATEVLRCRTRWHVPTMQDTSKIRTAVLAGIAGLALTFGTACTDENGVEDAEVGGGPDGVIEQDPDAVEDEGAITEDEGAFEEDVNDGLVEEDPESGPGPIEDDPATETG